MVSSLPKKPSIIKPLVGLISITADSTALPPCVLVGNYIYLCFPASKVMSSFAKYVIVNVLASKKWRGLTCMMSSNLTVPALQLVGAGSRPPHLAEIM